jgi:hypothetical protein
MAGRFSPETTLRSETVIRQNSYDHRFFEELGPEAETSAKVVVRLVCEIMAGTLSLRQLLSALPAALVRAIQRRIPKAVRPTRGG